MMCPGCGNELNSGDAFCERCGTASNAPCPGCGGQNAPAALFCSDCGHMLPVVGRGEARSAVGRPTLERRQLTVMFCDLVGSTALSARLELEDLHEAITAYQSCVDAIVAEYDGFVARHLGDGILCFFGYPLAQEDDAERAVRAALAIVDAVGALPVRDAAMQVRIGIATGTVVVGAFVSRAAAQPDVIGEAPNLAARLQSLAEPDTVVIADSTRRLVGSLFEARDLGAVTLKGVAGGLRAWQAVRPRAVQSRFAALRATATLPLIGREAEMRLLLSRWRMAAGGAGQTVLLSGEPGIGKSRVVEALRLALAEEAAHTATYSCAPNERNSALGPFAHGFRTAAGLERGDVSLVQIEKLAAWLGGRVADPAQAVGWFAEMLAIPAAGVEAAVSMSPQRRKEITLAYALEIVTAPARHGPALLLIEDLHWADPTSLELIELIVDRTPSAGLLVVATARPEFSATWAGQPHASSVPLQRLTRQENVILIRNVVGGKSLPPEVTELILSRTDGVPLFIEELTKATLESGLLREETDRYALDAPFSWRAIPSTLHDSLMARLDRLGEVKAVAQIGAAIGRTFSLKLLSVVAHMPELEVDRALGRLAEAALVQQEPEPPPATYTFRHALVQDVAYASLLRRDRALLHGRIVRALDQLFPDMRDLQPELLAEHHAAAGSTGEAVACWLLAGERARQRSALTEAVGHLTRGLDAVAGLPPSPARDRQELDLRVVLGVTYMALKGWAGAEIETVLTPASALCHALGDAGRLTVILRVLWQYHATRGHHREAASLVTAMQETAQAYPDPVIVMNATYSASASSFWRGAFASAAEHAATIMLHEQDREQHAIALFGTDPNTATLNCWESYRLWIQGHVDQAVDRAVEQEAHARRLRYPFNLCFMLTVGAAVYGFRRDVPALRKRIDEAMLLAREQSMPFIHAVIAPLFDGPALIEAGRCEDAFTRNRAALARWHATGGRLIGPYLIGIGAEALLRLGRLDEGLQVIGEALAEADWMNERWAEADLWRIRGDLLVGKHDTEGAEGAYQHGLRIAREQGARSWELRLAIGLARLRVDRADRVGALSLLGPLLDWFREGQGTPDLQCAIGMVQALA